MNPSNGVTFPPKGHLATSGDIFIVLLAVRLVAFSRGRDVAGLCGTAGLGCRDPVALLCQRRGPRRRRVNGAGATSGPGT